MRYVILRFTAKNILKDKKKSILNEANECQKDSGTSSELLGLKISLLFLVETWQSLVCNSPTTNQRILTCKVRVLLCIKLSWLCKGFRKSSINWFKQTSFKKRFQLPPFNNSCVYHERKCTARSLLNSGTKQNFKALFCRG